MTNARRCKRLIEGDAALTTDRWLLGKAAAALTKDALPKYQALPAGGRRSVCAALHCAR